ncbi:hypothetical protein J7T55_000002 [Diaporthe amygdali]|uniref:uncharacterized protein n=1 Tax=Phomopsis amygdali TaxID=1214568 RepID=UPI0022FE5CF3|nr:uncharacterized protein J7T55_000002 [Diaporthe amygdali]KAJ0107740.1 hypothetical protein J7T55_000002 [Diaporthe amygdali]
MVWIPTPAGLRHSTLNTKPFLEHVYVEASDFPIGVAGEGNIVMLLLRTDRILTSQPDPLRGFSECALEGHQVDNTFVESMKQGVPLQESVHRTELTPQTHNLAPECGPTSRLADRAFASPLFCGDPELDNNGMAFPTDIR